MPPSARTIAVQICDLMPQIERAVSSVLRHSRQNLTPSHLVILTALARGPFTLSGLSEVSAVSPPTMSNSVTILVKRGWIKRRQSTDDRRFVEVELTSKGWKTLVDIRKQVELFLTTQLAPLPPKRRQDLKIALKTLLEIFENRAENAKDSPLAKRNGIQQRSRRARR